VPANIAQYLALEAFQSALHFLLEDTGCSIDESTDKVIELRQMMSNELRIHPRNLAVWNH
jgi:hypothetical protein